MLGAIQANAFAFTFTVKPCMNDEVEPFTKDTRFLKICCQ